MSHIKHETITLERAGRDRLPEREEEVRTNSEALPALWREVRYQLEFSRCGAEMEVSRYWFPDPTQVNWGQIIAQCPDDLEAHVLGEKLVVRKKG